METDKQASYESPDETPDTAAETVEAESSMPPPPVEPVAREASWMDAPWVSTAVRVVFGLIVLVVTWCFYVSRMPDTFDVNERAMQRALEREHVEEGGTLLPGYTTVSTVLELAEWLLGKPGGYLHNDRLFPNAYLIDNMPNFELGVVFELRDTVKALRENFSRSRGQTEELPYLIAADGNFSYDPDNWLVPSTESEYRQGIRNVNRYLQAIVDGGPGSGLFVSRQDVLERHLESRARRLGSFSVRLRRSAADGYAFNPNLERQNLQTEPDPLSTEYTGDLNSRITPWHRRDDEFYEVRGSVYVMYHVMLALRTDFEDELNDKRAMGLMNRILSELHAASQPLVCPVVLNGREYGFFHNHSLTAAAHIAKAHVAVNDLRILLRGGSDG